jgi:hypothetical protein
VREESRGWPQDAARTLFFDQLHIQSFWSFDGIVEVEADILSILGLIAILPENLVLVEKDLLTGVGDDKPIVLFGIEPLDLASLFRQGSSRQKTSRT